MTLPRLHKPFFAPPPPAAVRTLVAFLPNWIGDAVMATPALRALRTRYADATVVAVCRPPVGDVLAGTGLADEIVALPKSKRATWAATRGLRKQPADLAVLFPNSLRAAAVARLGGAKRTLGFARDGRRWLLTHPVPPGGRATPSSTLLSYNRLALAAECEDPGTQTELAVLPADEAAFEAVLTERPALRDGFVALNPGGAFGAAKHWPTPHFADLAARIAGTLDRGVLVLCGPGERTIAAEISALAGDPRVVTLGATSLQHIERESRPVDRTDESRGAGGGPVGHDRQRPPPLRRPAGRSGGHAVRPHAHRLERDVPPARHAPPTARRLRAVPATHLPAGAPQMHDGADAGPRVRRGADGAVGRPIAGPVRRPAGAGRRLKALSPPAAALGTVVAAGPAAPDEPLPNWWTDPAFDGHLAAAGMDHPEALLRAGVGNDAIDSGDVRRSVGDRVTRRLELPGPDGATRGFFLKTHVDPPGGSDDAPSGGRAEAEAVLALDRLGVPTMRAAAFAEIVDPDGSVRSGLLTDELVGYEQFDLLVPERFPPAPDGTAARDPALRELVIQCGRIARAFHAAGCTHRDFYTCHFMVKELGDRPGGRWDVRLIDLHRMQRHPLERRFAGSAAGAVLGDGGPPWRWWVKDFAQLLYSLPPSLPCRERVAFLRTYRGGRVDEAGRRLLAAARRKVRWMRWKLGPYRPGW